MPCAHTRLPKLCRPGALTEPIFQEAASPFADWLIDFLFLVVSKDYLDF
jgi:hypothetical protein